MAAVIVTTRPDEKRVWYIRGLQKALTTRALENKVNSSQLYAVLSEDFCAHKILSLKFMQILADDRETFA